MSFFLFQRGDKADLTETANPSSPGIVPISSKRYTCMTYAG